MKRLLCTLIVFTFTDVAAGQDGGAVWHLESTIRWWDSFDDADVANGIGGKWSLQFGHGALDVSSGDLRVTTNSSFEGILLGEFMGEQVQSRNQWSVAARMTVNSGSFAGVGTSAFNHAAVWGNRLRAGTNEGDVNTGVLPESLSPYLGEEILIQMDAFDDVIVGKLWREGDKQNEFVVSHSYSPASSFPDLGLGGNGSPFTDVTFHEVWISDQPIIDVPEPSSFVVAALGVGALAFRQWWRRRRSAVGL